MSHPLSLPSGVTSNAANDIAQIYKLLLEKKDQTYKLTEHFLQTEETRKCYQRFIPDFIFHSGFIHFALGDLLAGTTVPSQFPNWTEYRVSQLPHYFGTAVKNFALEHYSATRILVEEHIGSTIELYRGIRRDTAELLRSDLRSIGGPAYLHLPSLSSWADKPDLARAFAARGGGLVVKATWPAHSLFAHWRYDEYLQHTLRYQCSQHLGNLAPEVVGGEVIVWCPLGAQQITPLDIMSSFEQIPPASTLKSGIS